MDSGTDLSSLYVRGTRLEKEKKTESTLIMVCASRYAILIVVFCVSFGTPFS